MSIVRFDETFDSLIFATKMELFATAESKKLLLVKNEKDELTDEGKLNLAKHTCPVELNFKDVTVREALQQHASTTSFLKKWVNNIGKNLTDEQIISLCKVGLKVSVRELIDGTRSPMTEEAKKLKTMKAELAKGKSVEQLRAEYEAMLAQVELELGLTPESPDEKG